MRFLRYASRHTQRHADRNTSHPLRGWCKKVSYSVGSAHAGCSSSLRGLVRLGSYGTEAMAVFCRNEKFDWTGNGWGGCDRDEHYKIHRNPSCSVGKLLALQPQRPASSRSYSRSQQVQVLQGSGQPGVVASWGQINSAPAQRGHHEIRQMPSLNPRQHCNINTALLHLMNRCHQTKATEARSTMPGGQLTLITLWQHQ